MWPAAHQDTSQWNRVADREGFIVVYPSGLDGDGPRHWEATPNGEPSRDVAFIGDLIDSLGRTYNIDPARIYANGLSNGGGMSFVLSCTLSDRIAAVGLVASAQLLPWSSCADDRPVPMINFHGTADRRSIRRRQVMGRASDPAQRSRMDGQLGTTKPLRTDAGRIRGSRPTSRASNTRSVPATPPWCSTRFEGGGHTWPGGGRSPRVVCRDHHPHD